MEIYQIPHVILESTSQFFLQFFFQCSVPSNIAPLYFFRSDIIYFCQRSQLNSRFFRFSSSRFKMWQIPFVNFEMTIQFLFKYCLFFIFMTHNSSVNFKVIHFLSWMKESHQSPNFDTFECSAENFPNSSCHFLNQSKCKVFRISSARVKIHQILVTFETKNQLFFKFCIALQAHET